MQLKKKTEANQKVAEDPPVEEDGSGIDNTTLILLVVLAFVFFKLRK